MCYISHFNQTNPETIGWFRSLCSCEPGSVGNGWDGDTRGPKNPRNCESGVAVGSATCWAPRAGALAPTVPRLSQRPGTRDSFHCCTSAVAMLEGEPLDLGSLPSAGSLQPPAWGSPRRRVLPVLAKAFLRDPTCLVLRDAGSVLRSPGVSAPAPAGCTAPPRGPLPAPATSGRRRARIPGAAGRQKRRVDQLGAENVLSAESVRRPHGQATPGETIAGAAGERREAISRRPGALHGDARLSQTLPGRGAPGRRLQPAAPGRPRAEGGAGAEP